MARRRLGLVLLVDGSAATEIDGLRRALGDGMLRRIGPHCTLVPPVNVHVDAVASAVEVVRAAAAAAPGPLPIALGPVATFAPVTPTVYLRVGGPGLEDLISLRNATFLPPLARDLDHPYVPHVTIADDADPTLIPPLVAGLAGWEMPITFTHVSLFEEGEDRRWHAIGRFALGPPAVVGRGGLPLEITETVAPTPDVAAWADKEWEAFDLATLGGLMTDTRDVCFTARRSGEVVGMAKGNAQAGVGWLSQLLVAESERGTGVGGRLVDRFVTWCAAAGCRVVGLRTQEGTPAVDFYRSRGFVELGPAHPWYHGHGFFEMVKELA